MPIDNSPTNSGTTNHTHTNKSILDAILGTEWSKIIYVDSNWGLAIGYGTNQAYFRSRESSSGESATGKLEIGYFKLIGKLVFLIAGGGATGGNLKSLEIVRVFDNIVVATYTLSTMLGGINTDLLQLCTIDTSSLAGTNCFLRFKDSDSNLGWAWIGLDISRIYVY